jgi:hypothetical protein
VDDATSAIMPPNPEMIQVGDAIWQGAAVPAAWNSESNVAVKLTSRSCRTNFARYPASSMSMSRFRACCTTKDWAGCSVAPRIRMRRVPCSMAART